MGNLLRTIDIFYKKSIDKNKLKDLVENKQFAILVCDNCEDYKVEVLKSKEKSFLIHDIDFDSALSLANDNKQNSFIYKPKNGPVQLISIKNKYVSIIDNWFWDGGDKFINKCMDGNSFEFDFKEEKLEYKNKPYLWDEV